jgi:hypothetical protein
MSTLAEKTGALAVDVSCSKDVLSVTLSDGRVISVPLVWFPRLVEASPRRRSDWELIGGGIGVHWEALDEDISVSSLLHPENFVELHRKDATSNSSVERSRARSRRKRGMRS